MLGIFFVTLLYCCPSAWYIAWPVDSYVAEVAAADTSPAPLLPTPYITMYCPGMGVPADVNSSLGVRLFMIHDAW